MPYYRRRGTRSTYRKRPYRRTYRRKTTTKRYVRKVVQRNLEMKKKMYLPNAVGQAPFSNGLQSVDLTQWISYGSGTHLTALVSGITNGTSDSTRIGDKIRLRGVHIDFNVYLQAGSTTYPVFSNTRVILFSPKKSLWQGGTQVSTVAGFCSKFFVNYSADSNMWCAPINTELYRVYYDKRKFFKFTPTISQAQGVSYSSPSIRRFRKFIKFNRPITWGKDAYVCDRDVFLMIISDDAEGATSGGTYVQNGIVSVYYNDG